MKDQSESTELFDGSNLSAWVKWYGPYRSKRAWERAAQEHIKKNNFTLYLAIGRWRMFSMAFTRPLYLGLKSKDRNDTVDVRLEKHRTGVEENRTSVPHKKITGFMNEYWLGEIQTRWHQVQYTDEITRQQKFNDTSHKGMTSDIEKALIFCINPILNTSEVKVGPNFDFQIINEVEKTGFFSQGFRTAFERKVFGLYKYEHQKKGNGKYEKRLILGEVTKPRISKIRRVEEIEKTRESRTGPKDYGPFCYRIFGSHAREHENQGSFN